MPFPFRCLVLCLAASLPAIAAEMSGYVSDAACGWNNARAGKEARECAQRCVKAGWPPVFVPDGKVNVYKFRDSSRVMNLVGEHVTVSATIDKDVLTVSRVRKSLPPKAP